MNIKGTYLATLSLAGFFLASIATAEKAPPKLLLGQAETQMRCLICHGDQQTGQKRLAPPMVMVKRHYQSMDQDDFEKAILSWVKKPDADKSRMPGAIRRFNLMPAFSIPDEELKRIAQYIHQTDFSFPENCKSEPASSKKNKTGKGCDDDKCGTTKGDGKGKTKADKAATTCPEENC